MVQNEKGRGGEAQVSPPKVSTPTQYMVPVSVASAIEMIRDIVNLQLSGYDIQLIESQRSERPVDGRDMALIDAESGFLEIREIIDGWEKTRPIYPTTAAANALDAGGSPSV